MQEEKIPKVPEAQFQDEVNRREPLVVDFYADWCPPCKIVSPILDGLAQEYNGRVRFIKVNVDEAVGLASKFGIMSIPTVMFFGAGKAQDAVIGAVSAAAYKRKIDDLLKSNDGKTETQAVR